MFKEILLYELKNKFSRVSTYLYWLMMFGFAFLAMSAVGGAFSGATVHIGPAGQGKVFINTPITIFILSNFLTYFGLFIVTAIAGNAACRDFEERSYPLLFTTPVSKLGYFGGRFTASFLTSSLVMSGTLLGSWVATLMPYIKPDTLGPQNYAMYIQPYFTTVLPNVFFISAFFFAAGLYTRKMMSIYVSSAILFMGYLIGTSIVSQIKQRLVASLIEPFGLFAASTVTEYWTVHDINSRLVPFSSYLLYNRILWIMIACTVLIIAYRQFTLKIQKTPKEKTKKTTTHSQPTIIPANRPKVTQHFSWWGNLKNWSSLLKIYLLTILKNKFFAVFAFIGIVFMLYVASTAGEMYETQIYPVTWAMLDVASGSFTMFMLLIIVFYAGELVWFERRTNSAKFIDALPHPDWVPFSAKIGTLFVIIAIFQAIVMVSGMLIQTFKGYFNYEPMLYITSLFGLQMPAYWLYATLAISIQTIANNKYAGHFYVIFILFIKKFIAQFGLEHSLYRIYDLPHHTYSDMNGFGNSWQPWLTYLFYWALFTLLIALLAYAFRIRGEVAMGRHRLCQALHRFSGSFRMTGVISCAIWVVVGGYIFYNTNILNTFTTSYDGEIKQKEYEVLYKKYEKYPQLRITDIKVHVELYPSEKRFTADGIYTLKNKRTVPVSEIIIQNAFHYSSFEYTFGREVSRTVFDEKHGFMIYTLKEPMQPGETCTMNFKIMSEPKGFTHDGVNSRVMANGTFINSGYFPSLGYNTQGELQSDKYRKKHALEPKERMASIDDMNARMNTYISNDSDWVTYDVTIGTEKGQIAVAPGNLLEHRTEGDREYYRYSPQRTVLHFYAICSADYTITKDVWNDVAIEIYHDKKHPYNVQRMIDSVKKSLDYYTTHFSPYPDKVIRIVEFPRYANYAQSFPTMIPYSESVGFIAKVTTGKVDYPFNITAHEMAHQWWAHQVIGGNVQGVTLMSEVFSQYSALMVTAKEQGTKITNKYLRYDIDSYLRARSREIKKELPLYLNENQGYLHYQKGVLVMNCLQHYIGEERINKAMAEYCKTTAFQEPPYTISTDFITILRKHVQPEYQQLVTDLLEKITLYDFEIKKVIGEKKSDTEFSVTLTMSATKKYADEKGEETDATITEPVTIVVYNDKEEELYRKKHMIQGNDVTLVLELTQKPASVVIDPDYLFIDRDLQNNTKNVTIK